MRKHLKNYLVPHEDNDHKPHILRGASVLILSLVILATFAFSALHASWVVRGVDFLAAIFPAVLVDLTNEDRAENELMSLTVSLTLHEAAQLKANHMAENSYFSHVSPDGTTPWHWFGEAGYKFTHAGENLAVNFADSGDVEQAWMESPGHRANILNGNYTEIGIAMADGIYNGRKTIFVVQFFGSPSPVFAQTSVAPEVQEASVEPAQGDFDERLVVVEETDTFIAVENPGAENRLVVDTEGFAGAEAVGLARQANFWQRLASQPRSVLQWVYTIIGAVVLLVLTAMILIEIEKQHPKNVAYGLLLLVLLFVLVYINRTLIFPDLLVV